MTEKRTALADIEAAQRDKVSKKFQSIRCKAETYLSVVDIAEAHDLSMMRVVEVAVRRLAADLQAEKSESNEPKVCTYCIEQSHAIAQWEKEYYPGCVCACHIAPFAKNWTTTT